MEKTWGLIVGSSCDMANFMEIVLGLAGFECQAAYSPSQALQILSQGVPDLIFLDLDLRSGEQASDLLTFIRSNPRFDKTRLVVLTGQPSLAHPAGSLADLLLPNPVESERLCRMTSRLSVTELKPHDFRDPVTGLYNLKFFNTRLELAIERAKRRPDFRFALLAVELSAQGEQGGAEPLSDADWEQAVKLLAGRWRAKFRPTNAFGRYARKLVLGLFEDLKGPQDVQVIQGRLVEELKPPFDLEGGPFVLTARSGGVFNSMGNAGVQEMLDAALQALECARRTGEALHFMTDPIPYPPQDRVMGSLSAWQPCL